MNATESAQRYKITVSGLPGLVVTSESEVSIASTEARVVPVRVQAPSDVLQSGFYVIQFVIVQFDCSAYLAEI